MSRKERTIKLELTPPKETAVFLAIYVFCIVDVLRKDNHVTIYAKQSAQALNLELLQTTARV